MARECSVSKDKNSDLFSKNNQLLSLSLVSASSTSIQGMSLQWCFEANSFRRHVQEDH